MPLAEPPERHAPGDRHPPAGNRVLHAVGIWTLLAFLCVVLTRCPLP